MQGDDLADFALVGPRPQAERGAALDELRRQAHPRADAQERSFEHRIDVQLAGDLRNRLGAAFVTHRRGPRNDAQRIELSDFPDERVGNAICEILLVRRP